MKRWREVSGGSVRERREVLVEALRLYPNRSQAAAALGINRQYLYELLGAYGISTRDTPDTSDTPDTVRTTDRTDSGGAPDSVGSTDTPDSDASDNARGAVGPTQEESLTYGRPDRTFATAMSTAIAANDAQTEPTVRTAVDLPKDVSEWLELEAVREKQQTGASRPAKSPIVVRALRRMMREQQKGEAE